MTPDAYQIVIDLSNERAERLDRVRAILREWAGQRIAPAEALTQISRTIDQTIHAVIRRPGKGELQEWTTIEAERALLEGRLKVLSQEYQPAPGGPAAETARVQAGCAALGWVLNYPDPQAAGWLFVALTSRP